MSLDGEDNNLSQSSAMDGTEEIAVDPEQPPTRGLPTRPTAERDVMAVLAAAFVIAGALSALTAAITWDGRAAAGPWPLFALVDAPNGQTSSARRLAEAAALARVLGVLALPLGPLLEARDRHERRQQPAREDIERALITLLGLPRTVASLVYGGLATVALSDALIAGHQLRWSWATASGHLGLWLALAGPIALLSAAGVRQAVRLDILATPADLRRRAA